MANDERRGIFQDFTLPNHLIGEGVSDDASINYLTRTAPTREVDSWTDHLPNFIKSAYNESITGLADEVMSGKKRFDLSGYDSNVLEDVAAQIFSFVMPLDFATLGVGAKVGTTFAKPVVRKLMAAKVPPRVAERAAKLGAAKAKIKAINQGTRDATMLGFYDGLHSGIEQQAEEGQVDLKEVLKATAAGTFLGASMGSVGGYMAGKGITGVRKTAGEVVTLGAAIPISEARVPNPDDVIGAAGMVLGIKGAGKTLGLTKRTYNAIKYLGDKKIEASGLTPEVIAKQSRKEVAQKRKKILAQRSEPEKILFARKKAAERGDKIPGLAEIWYSKLGSTPKGGRREVIIGKTFKDPDTKKNMIPLYDVASGKTLTPMLESRFYDTHIRFKAGIKEASGVISFNNFAKKSASHKQLAKDLEQLTLGKKPTIFAEQAQIIMETLKGVDEKTIKNLRVGLSRQLKKSVTTYTDKGGRTKVKGPVIRVRAQLAEKLREQGVQVGKGKNFQQQADAMSIFLETFGSHTWFKGLSVDQRKAARDIFTAMKVQKVNYVVSSKGGKDVSVRISALEKYFREGGASASEAKMLSKNPESFFSKAFSEYALTSRVPTRQLAPFYKNMMGELAENLTKVRSRNKEWGAQQQILESMFDSILGRKAPTRIKKTNLKKYRISAIKRMEKTMHQYGMTQQEIAKLKSAALGTTKQVHTERLGNKSLEKIIDRLRFERDVMNTQRRMHAIKANIAELPKNGLFEWLRPLAPVESTLKRTKVGREVTASVDNYLSVEKNVEGRFYERLREAGIHIPFSKLKPGAQKRHATKIADDMEDPRVQTEFNKIMGAMYDEFVKPLAKKGVKIQKRLGNYFPRILREDVANIIFDDTYRIAKLSKLEHLAFDRNTAKLNLNSSDFKRLNKIIDKLSDQKQLKLHRYTKGAVNHLINTQGNGVNTKFEAINKLREMSFRDKFISFGNIEKSRKAQLPAGFYERRADIVLHRYATKLARRVAYVENFGPKGEKMVGRIKELERRDPEAARITTQMFDQLTGIVEMSPDKGYSPFTKKFLNEWMSFSVATKIGLGLATIPNITQSLISTIADAGYMNFFQAALKGASASRRKFVREAGVVNYSVNKEMFGQRHDSYLSKVADKVTFFSGFQTINKINNWLAASTAANWIPKLHKQANAKAEGAYKIGKKSFSKREWARGKLKDLNIDYKSKITEDTIRKGMVKFARDSQLQKNVLKDPLFFNSPQGRPFVTFKRFGLRQFHYSKNLMWNDYKRGNILPTIRMAMGGMAGGVGVIWAKNQVRELLSGEPHYRDDEGAKSIIANIAAVGAFGVATDIMSAESKLGSAGFLLTPVQFSDIGKIYTAMQSFERDMIAGYGVDDAAHRSVIRVASVFGTLTKEASKRIQPEEQKKNRILQLKGRRRTEILELFVDSQELARKGNRESAIEKRKEGERKWERWNDAYREMGYYTDKLRIWNSFALTLDDLSYKEVAKMVATKGERRRGKQSGQ